MNELDPDEQARVDRHDAKVRRRQTVRLVTVVVLAAAFVAVALDNRQDVAVGWVVDEARVPLVLALVLSFAVGAVVGTYGGWRRRKNVS